MLNLVNIKKRPLNCLILTVSQGFRKKKKTWIFLDCVSQRSFYSDFFSCGKFMFIIHEHIEYRQVVQLCIYFPLSCDMITCSIKCSLFAVHPLSSTSRLPNELLQSYLSLAIPLDWKLTVFGPQKDHSCLWQSYKEKLFKGPLYLFFFYPANLTF